MFLYLVTLTNAITDINQIYPDMFFMVYVKDTATPDLLSFETEMLAYLVTLA